MYISYVHNFYVFYYYVYFIFHIIMVRICISIQVHVLNTLLRVLNHLFGQAATYYPKSWGQLQNTFCFCVLCNFDTKHWCYMQFPRTAGHSLLPGWPEPDYPCQERQNSCASAKERQIILLLQYHVLMFFYILQSDRFSMCSWDD